MVYCNNCEADVEVVDDEQNGFSCCSTCGRVVEDFAFATDVQFAKGADGEGEMVGHFVGEGGQIRGMARYSGGRMWGGQGDSHESALARGRQEISALVEHFGIKPPSEATEAAHRLYKLAMQRGFTRGRRVAHVAATCLYIYCRQEKKPYMLIDFSDHLSINVFQLGGVYLHLLRVFRLDDYPAFTRPIDPSLYLHRFVDRLEFGDKDKAVGATALRLVQSMKRDWMQTGRRPSGICGAALFIAAHVHGFERTKKEIIRVVHVGWSTVEKRVAEFAASHAGALTFADFEERARAFEEDHVLAIAEAEKQAMLALPAPNALPALPAPGDGEGGGDGTGRELALVPADPNAIVVGGVVYGDAQLGNLSAEEREDLRRKVEMQRTGACEHVAAGAPALAHGMCRRCFMDYLEISGGIVKGAVDPPCYTQGLVKEWKKAQSALEANKEGPSRSASPAPGSSSGGSGLAAARAVGALTSGAEADPLARDRVADPDLDSDLKEMDAALQREELGQYREGLPADAAAAAAAGAGGSGAAAAARAQRGSSPGAEAAAGATAAEAAGEATQATQAVVLALEAPPGMTGAAAAEAGAGKAGKGEGEQEEEEAEGEEGSEGRGRKRRRSGSGEEEEGEEEQAEEEAATQKAGSAAAAAAEAVAKGQEKGGPGEEPASQAAEGKAIVATQKYPSQKGVAEEEEEPGEEDEMAAGGKLKRMKTGEEGEEEDEEQQEGEEKDEEEPQADTLSDVDEDDIAAYLASPEEAELKEMLWKEMNKDWLEKQAQREAAAALAAANGGPQKDKPKRAYTRKAKAAVGPQETAKDAAKAALEARKLSNKINYNALADLFSDNSNGGGKASGGAGSEDGEGYGGGGGGGASFGRAPSPGIGGDDEGGSALGMGERVKLRAAQKVAEQQKDLSRYSKALQEEQSKRGLGGSLGGGFLGSLTFASGGGDGGAGRRVLGGLGMRPRAGGR